ncbi:hypothetical protein AcW1_010141 [Taiwanofungus camphoratus]|nr:hypothetical protein AcW1_010141 [Antrodia cinnamomea]
MGLRALCLRTVWSEHIHEQKLKLDKAYLIMLMLSQALLALTAFLVSPASAFEFQLPFSLPFLSSSSQTPLFTGNASVDNASAANRIAIIGAGAGGSSAAFWISKAKERFGLDVEVDVFERNNYIGGRSTVVFPYDNPEFEPVELGASIFVNINKNLWRATEEFGLERINFGDDDNVMGLWDGSEILLTTGGGSLLNGWWDTVKIIWRYGYQAPTRTKALVKFIQDKILVLYGRAAPRFTNLTSLADTLGWRTALARTTAEFFDTQGIDRRWTRELVEAATRVNYGQNVDAIHALEGLASLVPTGASSVKSGNFQIFENFLRRSNASVHLNTSVTAIARDNSGSWIIRTNTSRQAQAYRAVILAAPFHSTSIALSPPSLASSIPVQPYVHLHVTLLSTSSRTPNPAYFGLKGETAPTEILTTYQKVRMEGAREPEFNSMTYHGKVQGRSGETWEGPEGEEWVVKIFSKERITDDWLESMFGKVGWVLRKEWDAYPVLPPTTTFPPIKLAQGLYYVNAFEPFISTMETETVSARNAVDLLLQDEFDAGICDKKPTLDADEGAVYTYYKQEDKDFLLGWDC